MSEQHSSGLPIVPQESFELNRVASLGATWDPSTGCLHLAHMLGGSWVSTLLILTMKETLWLVKACPHGFPRLSLCPWVSQSCTAPSGLRLSTCHLHSCGSNEVKEQTVPVYSPRGSDVPVCTLTHTAYTSSVVLQPQKCYITLSVWQVKWCRCLLMGLQCLVIVCGPLLFPLLWNAFKLLCPFFYWFVFFLLIDRNSWYLLPVGDPYFIPWWCFSWMKDLNYNE